jgi:hypothetical protein
MGINEVKKDEPELPKDFKKIKNIRHSNAISIIDFSFRGIPNKIGQHYAFGGRVEVNFKAYVLNDDELKLFKDKLSQSDLNDALKLVQGMTEESLEQINVDLDEFLGEKKEKKEKKSDSENTNPFSALLDIFRSSTPKKPTKEEEKKFLNDLKEKGIKPDNYVEKYIRNLAEAKAINQTFTIYDIYKKSHGMASFPYREEASANPPETEIERIFGLK